MPKRAPKKKGSSLQLPLDFMVPTSEWTPPNLSELPDWRDFTGRVAIDTETKDPKIKDLGPGCRRGDGYIVGYSVAIEEGPAFYVPIRHEGGGNVDCKAGLAYLRDMSKGFRGEVVGANLSYDIDWLSTEDIEFSQAVYRDIQILDPLLYELHFSYSLANIGKRLGIEAKDEQKLKEAAAAFNVDPKGGMWRLHSKFVGPYATRDGTSPLEILRLQEAKMERLIEQDLAGRQKEPPKTLRDVWELESKVLPLLVKLRQRGVKINEQKLAEIRVKSIQWEREQLNFIKDKTGVDIGLNNIYSAEAVAPAIEALGVKLEMTKGKGKGKPQAKLDQGTLKGIGHPVADAIIRARKVNKLRTTFVSSIMRHMVNGRIHASYNQVAVSAGEDGKTDDTKGVRYGRLSSDTPNIQQQPSRDDFAAEWRSIYVPDAAMFCSNDYSQQEPRWTTHFAAELDLPKARGAAQAYHDNPNLDNHQFMADLTGLPRKQAKNVYLGLCYGEGGAKLANDLQLPTQTLISGRVNGKWQTVPVDSEAGQALAKLGKRRYEGAGPEAQHIIDTFDERAPFIRQLATRCKKAAARRGYVTTIGGRRLNFPIDNAGNFDWTHKALNRVIQGSSADQTKTAMVALAEELPEYHMQMQVHDEINASIDSPEIGVKAARIMSECIPARVPFRVDVEIGPSWGEAELYEA